MVKVLLSGCCGKMGTVISNLVSEFPNLEIVAGIDKFPKESNYPVFISPDEVNIDYDAEAEIKQYRINGGEWLDYTDEFTITENGTGFKFRTKII